MFLPKPRSIAPFYIRQRRFSDAHWLKIHTPWHAVTQRVGRFNVEHWRSVHARLALHRAKTQDEKSVQREQSRKAQQRPTTFWQRVTKVFRRGTVR